MDGFIYSPADPSLTISSLTSVLESVDWDMVYEWLDFPLHQYEEIKDQHSSNRTECNNALCEWYLTNHPAPSWRHVAEALYHNEQHEVLEVLMNKVDYLKGIMQPMFITCMLFFSNSLL